MKTECINFSLGSLMHFFKGIPFFLANLPFQFELKKNNLKICGFMKHFICLGYFYYTH